MTDRHSQLLLKLADLRKLVDSATLGPWRSVESRDTWTLHGEARSFKGKLKGGAGPSMQIIKAPKHSTPYAEYWPNAADSELIVEAVNRMSFWLDWAEDVLTRHFPVPCACNKVHPLLCSVNRTHEWDHCPEVMALMRAIDKLHRGD